MRISTSAYINSCDLLKEIFSDSFHYLNKCWISPTVLSAAFAQSDPKAQKDSFYTFGILRRKTFALTCW
jgi:hypothetical protein